MRIRRLYPFPSILFLIAILLQARPPEPLKLLLAVTVKDLEGPVQRLAVDLKGQRLFLAATAKNAIEVFDAQTLKHLDTIAGMSQPQDLVYLPESGKLLVSNAADGSLRIYDGKTFKLLDSKRMGGDAERIRVSPDGKTAYVGWGVGGMAAIDLQGGKRSDIKLRSHPAGFVMDAVGSRIFVNLPGLQQMAVIDRRSQIIEASWPLHPFQAYSGIALDEDNRRIFIASQKPSKLVVLNMSDGSVVSKISTAWDASDVFYDRERKRVYVIGAEGVVATYQQKSADEYSRLPAVETASGSQSGLFVPEWNRLFVVVRSGPPVDQTELFSFATVQ